MKRVAPRPESLRTERLLLRRARPTDLAAIHLVLSDPRAMTYWSSSVHSSLEESEEWLRSMIDSPPDESNDFLVELDGEVIGKVGSWRLPEIGFILHPDHWGRGLAEEAARAVIASTFATFDLPALKADVDPRNLPSIRLLKRLGFEETGRASRTWFVNDAWADSLYLTLRREDFDNGDRGDGMTARLGSRRG